MNNLKKRGLLIIMSGPSGVGKGTIREELMKDESLKLFFSVSMTTRNPRPGEQNGREYYFVTREEFDRNIERDNFLEWAEYCTNRYGTPKDKVEAMRDEGKNVLLEIDVKGTSKVLDKLDKNDVTTIFIAPPSVEELEKRIRGRSTETEDAIQRRLAQAKGELEYQKLYKHVVINDDLAKAVDDVRKILIDQM